jgi:hypothetical protein
MAFQIVILVTIQHHVNRFMTMRKDTLHILSFIAAFLLAIHYYRLDRECFFKGDIFFSLILLVLPFLWNRWLYNELTKDAKNPISYKMFINIGTFTYMCLIIFIVIIIIIDYRPSHYVKGIC